MWEDELMQETGGDFVLAHVISSVSFSYFSAYGNPSYQHSDLRRFLYDHALEAGVKFRANCRVVAIDPKNRRVTLQSGEVLKADVIIGADGWAGCSRKVILQGKREQIVNTGISMYK
jgi:salicylate hydroxylase